MGNALPLHPYILCIPLLYIPFLTLDSSSHFLLPVILQYTTIATAKTTEPYRQMQRRDMPAEVTDFFISREDGSCTPLIPADELPHWISLGDIPRSLPFQSATGRHVAHVPVPGAPLRVKLTGAPSFPVDAPVSSITRYSIPTGPPVQPVHTEKDVSSTVSVSVERSDDDGSQSPPPKSNSLWTKKRQSLSGPKGHATATEERTAPSQSNTPPGPVHLEPKKKIYCSHWIRTGECDYEQQGCKYKHEMPDLATLKTIGFQSVPTWWTSTYGRRPTQRLQVGGKQKFSQRSNGSEGSAGPLTKKGTTKAEESNRWSPSPRGRPDAVAARSRQLPPSKRVIERRTFNRGPAPAVRPAEFDGDLIEFDSSDSVNE